MAEQWDGRPQNPERDGWPDAEEERLWALAPTHLRVLVDRRIAARVAAARREGIEAAAEAAQKHALSEGWSNTSALRFRNCILALLGDGR